jgi:hypothetical protein
MNKGTTLTIGDLSASSLRVATMAPCRYGSNTPSAYRLRRTKEGELVMQGGYVWTEGFTNTGIEWKDIPTVEGEEE